MSDILSDQIRREKIKFITIFCGALIAKVAETGPRLYIEITYIFDFENLDDQVHLQFTMTNAPQI